ncbi:interleukin-1 receptor-associated kinase-like 2 isoform X2 [Narcine bancroftii]|uniref:interleukin-1 receptor-associated kinase-like 2 isoform X2 n=1 Tax=Narcine bancroftii TaxID=1343680 RepID=UPI003831BD02
MALFGRGPRQQQGNATTAPCFVYDIPAQIMEEFYLVMDTLPPGLWHQFGSRIINNQTELRNIESFGQKHNSKTRELMWAWGMKQATVQQLLDILNELQLYRATWIILSLHKLDPLPGPSIPPDYLNSKQNRDKLDVPSSGVDNTGNRSYQETDQPPEILSSLWSLLDLKKATDNFNERYKIGQGAFGHVYRANRFNTDYAVKLLNKLDINVKITREYFCREVESLYKYRHPNIMALEGYCAENYSYCLIYHFMSNGSLENKLQCKNPVDAILWKTRLKIAVGTARAIQYLHQCEVPLIHGNIKSSNILLDEYFTPKLGDFGLVKIGPLSTDADQLNSHTTLMTKTLQGPLAYLPDEFVRHRWLSEKVDTFSFGIVLGEIMTGMKAMDESRQPAFLKDIMLGELEEENQTKNSINLEKTAYKICQLHLDLKGGLLPISLAVRFAVIACLCIKKKRPKMKEVYSMLESLESDLQCHNVHNTPEETEDAVCKLKQQALSPQENTEIQSPSLDPKDLKSLQPPVPTVFKGLPGNSEQLPDAKLLKIPCESDESDILCSYPVLDNSGQLSCKVCCVKTNGICSDYSPCSHKTEDHSKPNGCKFNQELVETNCHFVQKLSPSGPRASCRVSHPRDPSSATINSVCEFPLSLKDWTANSFNHIGNNYRDCSQSSCCNSEERITINSGSENSKSSTRGPSYQSFNISALCALEHSVDRYPGVSNGTSPATALSSSIEIGPHKKKLLDQILLYEEGKIDSAELVSAPFASQE